MTVRFGNVLGSRGSVVRRFQHQIRTGGPVTVSHPEVSRYFMTMKEAGLLVLEAGAMGNGGEVFILDMGQPLRILDLARNLITLSGLRPEEDVPIVIGELGRGEKVTEELAHDFEVLEPTRTPKIASAVRKEGENPSVEGAVMVLEKLAQEADGEGIVRELDRLLPEAKLREGEAASSRPGARLDSPRGG
jgi:FlaA1/EpsC-like NDP-sugar epimerase